MKRTPLYEEHVRLGAKMSEYAGYEMPIEYAGLVAEHHAVRKDAGVFDVSHMGEFVVRGKDAARFVDYVVTGKTSELATGAILYTFFLNDRGGVVDDLLVYREGEDAFLFVVNAANLEKDFRHLEGLTEGFDLELQNISDAVGQLALQGPNAEKFLAKCTDYDLPSIKPFHFAHGVEIAGEPCLVSRTGYTGEDGFEIYTKGDVKKIWRALIDVGVTPVGLGARDTLRFEAGLPLYGNELGEDITPLEAGLGFFVKLDKDDFVGKDALVRQKEAGIPRALAGIELTGRGMLRHGFVVKKDGREIGTITTGYLSPTLGKVIANALIEADAKKLGATVEIETKRKTLEGVIIDKRFLRKK